ncbi:hypothetical protein G7Y89_g13909 [Cudoniella acicularis]|uniref:C2H2-type domain-containing protein n=1 Tax=Cudoniella acicularis TaxID=354080 RepID=A0A8H4VVK2_9HELO|nr:hypothetical protein G7Y89_g13909 [Cudoniella acicularis]
MRFQCTVSGCKKRYFSAVILQAHITRVHKEDGPLDPRVYSCLYCDKNFSSLSKLDRHVESAHREQPQFGVFGYGEEIQYMKGHRLHSSQATEQCQESPSAEYFSSANLPHQQHNFTSGSNALINTPSQLVAGNETTTSSGPDAGLIAGNTAPSHFGSPNMLPTLNDFQNPWYTTEDSSSTMVQQIHPGNHGVQNSAGREQEQLHASNAYNMKIYPPNFSSQSLPALFNTQVPSQREQPRQSQINTTSYYSQFPASHMRCVECNQSFRRHKRSMHFRCWKCRGEEKERFFNANSTADNQTSPRISLPSSHSESLNAEALSFLSSFAENLDPSETLESVDLSFPSSSAENLDSSHLSHSSSLSQDQNSSSPSSFPQSNSPSEKLYSSSTSSSSDQDGLQQHVGTSPTAGVNDTPNLHFAPHHPDGTLSWDEYLDETELNAPENDDENDEMTPLSCRHCPKMFKLRVELGEHYKNNHRKRFKRFGKSLKKGFEFS